MWIRRISVVVGSLLAMTTSHAETIEEFYARHPVTLLIGYPSGSAYDIYARLVGRHLGRHIPGKPSVVVSNQPGASSLIAANALANTLPRDGSVIGAVFERIGLEPLVNPATAKFDGRSFGWIGSILKVTDVCMFWHAAPARMIEDAKKVEVIVGAAGEAGGSALAARVLNTFVGTKFKIIGGYGGADMFLAMERGETQARCGMSWGGLKASRPDWLEKKLVSVVVQMAMQKHAELPDVPLIMDMVSRPEDRDALQYRRKWDGRSSCRRARRQIVSKRCATPSTRCRAIRPFWRMRGAPTRKSMRSQARACRRSWTRSTRPRSRSLTRSRPCARCADASRWRRQLPRLDSRISVRWVVSVVRQFE